MEVKTDWLFSQPKMNFATSNIHKVKYRFTKWSGKSYSAFNSIGKEISIGVLSYVMIRTMGVKCNLAVHSSEEMNCLSAEVDDEEWDDLESFNFLTIFLVLLGSGVHLKSLHAADLYHPLSITSHLYFLSLLHFSRTFSSLLFLLLQDIFAVFNAALRDSSFLISTNYICQQNFWPWRQRAFL